MPELRKFSNVFRILAVVLGGSVATLAGPPDNLASGHRETDDRPFLGPFSASSLGSEIRALETSSRAAAPAELAARLDQARTVEDPQAVYLAVRALALTGNGSAAAQKALTRHLTLSPPENRSQLWHLSLETAALGLARSGHPDALRSLLLLARSSATGSPAGRAAERALLVYPASPTLTRSLLAPFDVPQPSARAVPEPCRLPDQIRKNTAPLPEGEMWAALDGLVDCQLPSDSGLVEELVKTARSRAVFGLRALSILAGRGAAPPDSGLSLAEKELKGDDPTRRSAAAWLLSVSRPERIAALLASRHPEVRVVANNQILSNGLREPEELSGKSWGGDWAAWPTLWHGQSTRQIRDAYRSSEAERRSVLTAPWSSRLSPSTGEPAASEQEIQSALLEGPAIDRAFAAYGLGFVAPAKRKLALGLLRRAYDSEGHPAVRPIICTSLGRHLEAWQAEKPGKGQSEERFHQAFARRAAPVDPNPTCRAILSGARPAQRGREVFVGWSAGEALFAPRVAVAPLLLEAAPDGFVGAVVSRTDESRRSPELHLFADCRKGAVETCDWPPLSPP